MLNTPPPPNGVVQQWRPRFALGPFLLVCFIGLATYSTVVQIRTALLGDSLPRPSPWIDEDSRPLDLTGADEVDLSGFLTVAFYDSRLKEQHRTQLVLAVDDGRVVPARVFQNQIRISDELTKRLRHQMAKPVYTFGKWKLKAGTVYAVQSHIGYNPEIRPKVRSASVHLQLADFENIKKSLPLPEIQARWSGPKGHLPDSDFVILDVLRKLHSGLSTVEVDVGDPVELPWDRRACGAFGWWNQWIETKPEVRSVEYLIHPSVSSCPYSTVSLLGVGRVLVNGIFGYSSRDMLHAYLHTQGMRHLGAYHRESGDNTCLMGEWWLPSVLTRWRLGWLPETDVTTLSMNQSLERKLILHVPESSAGRTKLIRIGNLFLTTDSGALRGPPGFPVLVHRAPNLDASDGIQSTFYREAVLYHDQVYETEDLRVRAGPSLADGFVEIFVAVKTVRSPIQVRALGLAERGLKFCAVLGGTEPGHLEVRTLTNAREMDFAGKSWVHRICHDRKSLDDGFSVHWRGRTQQSLRLQVPDPE